MMNNTENHNVKTYQRSDSSCCGGNHVRNEITRRKFVSVTGTGAFGTIALSGLSWASLIADQTDERQAPERKPLVVKPVLTYEIPTPRPQTSWRSWGGIQTEKNAADEIVRITGELENWAHGLIFRSASCKSPEFAKLRISAI